MEKMRENVNFSCKINYDFAAEMLFVKAAPPPPPLKIAYE